MKKMIRKLRKIAVVGAGAVGSSCAYAILNQCLCDEIVIIDANREKATAQVLDLVHGVEYMLQKTKVTLGTYKSCKDADIVILAAGGAPKKGENRLDTLPTTSKIYKEIVTSIMKWNFNGIFIVVSNPVDVITYQVLKLSGLPKNQVIGTGTILDSSRLKSYLMDYFDEVDYKTINAYCMGEHGDSQMIPWSNVTIAGYPIVQLLNNNKYIKELDLKDIENKVIGVGWSIYNVKGTTNYGIASCVSGIVKAIYNDEKIVLSISSLLEGEYGEYDVTIGVPTIIGRNGAEKVIEIKMNEKELNKFQKSIAILKSYNKSIGSEKELLEV